MWGRDPPNAKTINKKKLKAQLSFFLLLTFLDYEDLFYLRLCTTMPCSTPSPSGPPSCASSGRLFAAQLSPRCLARPSAFSLSSRAASRCPARSGTRSRPRSPSSPPSSATCSSPSTTRSSTAAAAAAPSAAKVENSSPTGCRSRCRNWCRCRCH